MDEDDATFAVTVTVNVKLPSGSPPELASDIVTCSLAADDRIYLVVEHTDNVLFAA